jgi:hypothetical protein
MDVSDFVDHVQDLSDLELATLLCLIAKEHCLFETADALIDDLASELALVSRSLLSENHNLTVKDRLGGIWPQLCRALGGGFGLNRCFW